MTFATLIQSIVGVDITINQFEVFTKLKCENTAVCLKSTPHRSFGVWSEAECVSACQHQNKEPTLCVGVNYLQPKSVCEMFDNDEKITINSAFVKDNTSGCQYIHVSRPTSEAFASI